MKNYPRFLFVFIFLVLLDQFSKFIFSDISVCNKNLAWNIKLAPGVFYFFWLIIFFLLLYFFLKSKSSFEGIVLTLILAGAFSNILDRLIHSCVIDFIDLKIFPIFNLADIYITIGVFLLILIYIKQKIPARFESRSDSGGPDIKY